MNTYAPDARQMAIVGWNGMDLTDFTSPLETVSHARNENKEKLYQVTIAGDTELISSTQNVSVARHIDIQTLLNDIAKYDILVIPGGRGFSVDSIPQAPGIPQALQAFSKLPSPADKPRVILSVCSGSFFLAREGLLKGCNATTHPISLVDLKKLCNSKGGANIMRQHYVDGGIIDSGHRIITSGGVATGFDATLYLIEQEQNTLCAERSRAMMDALWRKEAVPAGFA